MTRERFETLWETFGWVLIWAVAAHWLGWWVVPLSIGVGMVRAARS